MRFCSTVAENGLCIKSIAPNSKPLISDASSFFPVKKITGIVLYLSWLNPILRCCYTIYLKLFIVNLHF